MTTALTARNGLAIAGLDDLDKALGIYSRAGMSVSETALKLSIGSGLGLSLAQSLTEIHIIKGRPSIGSATQLAIIRSRGVRHNWIESTDTSATIELTIPGEPEPRRTTWTIAQAKTANLVKGDNWQNHPANMLRARCITTAIRMWCPEILGMTVYDADEMREGMDADVVAPVRTTPRIPGGETITVAAEPVPPGPTLDERRVKAHKALRDAGLLTDAEERIGRSVDEWDAVELDDVAAWMRDQRKAERAAASADVAAAERAKADAAGGEE